jgi:hypothetical protein
VFHAGERHYTVRFRPAAYLLSDKRRFSGAYPFKIQYVAGQNKSKRSPVCAGSMDNLTEKGTPCWKTAK